MVRTAVLIVDFQNEFAKDGGKLHPAVKKVMDSTGMLNNVPPLVAQARAQGALIVYSPVINLYIEEGRVKFVDDGKETTMDPHAYGDEDNLFEDGSWNAEIIDELKPLSGDVILHNRNDFSAFSGTILEQTLKTHDIQRLIISGFLTDICVLSTVKEIVEKGLSSAGMKTIVLMDGCAAKSVQVHFATINDALPGLADLMTTEEAKDMLIAYPCSECKPKKVIKRTKARKRFTMFDHVKRLRIAMIDKWVSGNSFVRFLDRDHDGMITYDEFYDFMHQFGLVAEAKVDPEEVFNILDTQGLGEVPTDVLLEALHFTDEDLETEGRGGLSDAERLPPFPSPFLIGLVAHNNMKPSMMKFVKDHLSFFSRVKLVTTGSTGRALSSLGLNVEHLVSSGPLGGDQEIGGLISQGKVAAIFFFTDPLSAHPHAADIEALNRICCVHDTIFANNPSTAKALVTALENSPFGYSRLTGLNPNIGREADVVTKYKEGQAKVIQSVSAKTEAAKSAESSQPETVQEKTRKSILRAPRKDTKAPIANYGDFIKRTRKSVVFH